MSFDVHDSQNGNIYQVYSNGGPQTSVRPTKHFPVARHVSAETIF